MSVLAPATEAVRRAIEVGRSEGARALAVKALAATCYSRLVLFERQLDQPLPELDMPVELELGLLDPAEAEQYAELVPGSTAEGVRARLQAGDRCFAARYRGRSVEVNWALAGTPRVPYLRGVLVLGRDELLSAEAFVAPDMRGRNVHPASVAYKLRRLQDAGYRRVLALILPENVTAMRVMEKLGYRRVGVAYGIGLGSFRRVFVVHR